MYWQGLYRPLHFFPRTAYAFAEAEGTITKKVSLVWAATGRDARPECDEPYFKIAFRGTNPLDAEFETAANMVFVQMKRVITKTSFA
jgi:exodeoxyribonuclease V gamma subunit